MPQLPTERDSAFLYSTARVKAVRDDDTAVLGTAFFFLANSKTNPNLGVPVLLTNKHVLENAQRVELVLHLADSLLPSALPSGELAALTVQKTHRPWLVHPDYDLAAISVWEILALLQREERRPYFVPITQDALISEDELRSLPPFGPILMVGYPKGLIDEVNNLPIGRTGHTATHPAVDFNGRAEALTNIPNARGSSGSPIFVRCNQAGDPAGGMVNRLLGVHRGGHYWSAKDGITERAGDSESAESTSAPSVPANIGVYVKAREITWIADRLAELADADTAKRGGMILGEPSQE